MHTITKRKRYEENTVSFTCRVCGVAENFSRAQCGSSRLPGNRNRKKLRNGKVYNCLQIYRNDKMIQGGEGGRDGWGLGEGWGGKKRRTSEGEGGIWKEGGVEGV